MMAITPQMRILVATAPADFRCGIDGLVRVCRARLSEDPFSGTAFVFRNRGKTAVKILVYDTTGFWLCHKRFSKSKLRWWPRSEDAESVRLAAHQLQLLLWNGDPSAVEVAPVWRRLKDA